MGSVYLNLAKWRLKFTNPKAKGFSVFRNAVREKLNHDAGVAVQFENLPICGGMRLDFHLRVCHFEFFSFLFAV
jgi:hypothetical protein